MADRGEALEKIATGGTATVFVAAREIQPGVRSLVAVKRLHPHLCEDAKEREALLDEARLLARIRHPHVVGLHDVRAHEDRVELVIDYVEGASLSELLVAAARNDERLAEEVVVRIVLDACAGLAAIHGAKDEQGEPLGIVHRDVSPQNVLVGVDGFSRIADLGTAKVHTRDKTSTTIGTLKGKLGYMAPEYVSRGQCDPRVDVFAMGVVTWEALAARRLFKGSNEGETLHKIEHEEAALISTVAPAVAPALASVVARALAKSPEERYPDVDSFARALKEASSGGADERDAVRRAVLAFAGDKLADRRKLEQSALARAATEEETVTHPVKRPPARRSRALVAAIAILAGAAGIVAYAATRSNDPAVGPSASETPPPSAGTATEPAQVAPSAAPIAEAGADAEEAATDPDPALAPTASDWPKVGASRPASPVTSASTTPSSQKRRPPPNPY